jgi:hypothetical protein
LPITALSGPKVPALEQQQFMDKGCANQNFLPEQALEGYVGLQEQPNVVNAPFSHTFIR